MKSILKLISISLVLSTFFISCNDDDMNTSTKKLTLNLSGLDALGDNYVYEGWIIVNGSAVSTGTFTDINFPQSFTIDRDKLDNATKFVLSIEPTNDSDPAPSDTKILAGDFSGNAASVTTGIVGDFSTSAGKYILATPTDGMNNNENSGIWFLDPSSGTPMAGLSLPTLPAGWIYEGWAVIDGKPVSTGTFTSAIGTDNMGMFSGAMALPMLNSDGFFPGEDFLQMAPSGLTFPTDLAGKTAVISIEPHPDNSPMPFTLKPLAGMIPSNATDHTVYSMNQNLTSFPSGTVNR